MLGSLGLYILEPASLSSCGLITTESQAGCPSTGLSLVEGRPRAMTQVSSWEYCLFFQAQGLALPTRTISCPLVYKRGLGLRVRVMATSCWGRAEDILSS